MLKSRVSDHQLLDSRVRWSVCTLALPKCLRYRLRPPPRAIDGPPLETQLTAVLSVRGMRRSQVTSKVRDILTTRTVEDNDVVMAREPSLVGHLASYKFNTRAYRYVSIVR